MVANILLLILALSMGTHSVQGMGWKRRVERAAEAEQSENGAEIGEDSKVDKRAKTGGWRQRISGAEAGMGGGSSSSEGPLTRSLMRDWAKGLLSSGKLQEYAAGALAQGATGFDRLARVGTYGKHPQNAYRDLVSLLGLPKGAPELTWLNIPTRRGPRTPHPFFLPHKFFQSIYKDLPRMWQSSIIGAANDCLDFWLSMQHTDFVTKHPALLREDWKRTIPIGMHGDGGSFSKQDSVFVLSWNSLLGEGNTIARRFVTTLIRKSEMTPATLEAICNIMSWSFNTMLTGETPSRDMHDQVTAGGGQTLAGGYRATLAQVRGDWQFYCELFKFPQWNSAERMCWLCAASSTVRNLYWGRFDDGAGWRATRYTHESYIAHLVASAAAIPTLLSQTRGFRLEHICIDVLHTVDLGITSHILGNIFWMLVVGRAIYGGTTQDLKISRLQERITSWYKSSKFDGSTRVKGKLTVDRMRTSSGWPKLKAQAAATRHLVHFGVELMMAHCDGSDHDNAVLALVQLIARFYEILTTETKFLSDAARDELPKLGRRVGIIYAWLATNSYAARDRMWKMTPKLHLFVHLCEWQSIYMGNPRFFWTYIDEDLVGKLIEVAESCHPSTLPGSGLFKWVHLFFK